MKKIFLFLIGIISLFINQFSYSQNYMPFSTDTAKWNLLCWAQWSATDMLFLNYKYIMLGDTVIKGMQYKKIYFKDELPDQKQYIGGLREDTLKQIFFFPSSNGIPSYAPPSFPNDTSEQLLYSFHNLSIGMVLPINSGVTTITVVGIDSVLVGAVFHKRYAIKNQNLFGYPSEYWIEGIGSTKELFAPYSYEFEWTYYTLCYEDSMSYYINPPYNADSCHYSLPLGFKNYFTETTLQIYPNPAANRVTVESRQKAIIEILNIEGQIIKRINAAENLTTIDISAYEKGMYFIKVTTEKGVAVKKFIKE